MNNIRIVWNITNKCDYQCDICATQAVDRQEVDLPEKEKVLRSIMSMKSKIREINFGGGDPLTDLSSRQIIQQAINYLGAESVSVSTTGMAISQLDEKERNLFLKNCSMTLDSHDFNMPGIRHTVSYNQMNVAAAIKFRKDIGCLTLNIPILRTSFTNQEMCMLASKINEIHPNRVTLIHLMPLGRQKTRPFILNYDPRLFIQSLKQHLESDIIIHLQCALRCLQENNKVACTMVNNKLGIDCEGNAFACCWSAYLDRFLDNNPFYLGNLCDINLSDLYESSKVKKIASIKERNKCLLLCL